MLLFLGVIGSARYSVEENVSLPINEPKEALGYQLTYKGATPIRGDEEKFHFNVVCEKEGKQFLLQPVMYYSDYSEGVMKNPDIANLVTKDLYLSPMALEEPGNISAEDVHSFKKGEEKDINGMKIKFIDFDRSKFNRDDMESGKSKDGQNIMGAELEVTLDGKTEKVTAEQEISEQGNNPVPVMMMGNDRYSFHLLQLSVSGESTISLAIIDETKPKKQTPETLVLTASIKPFINFVWGGTVVMVIGFFLALMVRYRRMKSESRKINALHSNGSQKKSHKQMQEQTIEE
jgi:cytochrome c-type biogenesis protein CcmF